MLDFGNGIHAIDAGYERAQLAAIHLIVDHGEVGVVDTGTNASTSRVLEALAALGLGPDAVRYVLLTHIHLDHAGGAGDLLGRCPNARLVVHPRGARHMADPSRLWAATVAVYGLDEATRMYGALVPVPVGRIVEATDGLELSLGSRTLRFIDTPGHARHHVAIADSGSGHVFAGDTFGISYRELDEGNRQFVIPTSSPTQFEPDAAHASVDRIVAHAPGGAVYVTHYTQLRDLPTLAGAMHDLIDRYRALALGVADAGPERATLLLEGMRSIVLENARSRGFNHPPERILDILDLDIGLNAQGLGSWLDAR
jgi:hydroxyacylglutathione hydrolase